MLLNNEGKKEFIRSKFHRYFNIDISIDNEDINVEQFVNFVLPKKTIEDYCDSIDMDLNNMLNEDCNNLIFSSNNDDIYSYEFYKNIYFVRLKPFTNSIKIHILPKKYDASNTKLNPILFFKDDEQTIDESNFFKTSEYERRADKNTVNLYYQEDEKILNSGGLYLFDIKKHTQNLKTLQINAGYSYNDSNPSDDFLHFLGILDKSDENGNPVSTLTEFNSSLVNRINYLENVSNNKDDEIIQLSLANINKDINSSWIDGNTFKDGINIDAVKNQVYNKTLKYFNDILYIEQDGYYCIAEWSER